MPSNVEALLVQETVRDLDLLGEPRDSLARRAEREAVRLVFALHPAGAHPERDAPAGDLVGRRGGACEHRRVTEGRR